MSEGDRRLRAIFSDVFQVDVDPATDDIAQDDIAGWDSISHLRLILELEEGFEITISDAEAIELNSLGSIRALLRQRGLAAGQG